MPTLYENLLEWTHSAGLQALEMRTRDLTVSEKTPRDLVTNADIAVDSYLRERILKTYPDHRILSEELAPEQTKAMAEGPLWIIDPIDGTHNYSRGHLQSAVSVAFADDGVVQYGAVFNPFPGEFFSAAKGQGALLDGEAIRCAPTGSLKAALIGVGRPYHPDDTPEFVRQIHAVLRECFDLRRLGSGALDICWVACGRLDGFFETLNPWDIAAAALIAREAGCLVGSFRDRPEGDFPPDLDGRYFLVSPPALHAELRELLR